jgi:membrane-bound inhibitor of C-type lysozyme
VTNLSALVGSEVRRLLLDHQVTIFLAGRSASGAAVSAQIIIDAPFQLERALHVDDVDPNRKETLPPSCRLLHTTVSAAYVEQDVLTVVLNDGSTLTVGPNARSASWQLVGQRIPHLVAALVPGRPEP